MCVSERSVCFLFFFIFIFFGVHKSGVWEKIPRGFLGQGGVGGRGQNGLLGFLGFLGFFGPFIFF